MSLHRLQSTSDRPLYRQLVDWLRVDLATKAAGDRIDSETQLAERFGVSRFTVTRAIEILVDEGLIRRRQGLGSFVAPAPDSASSRQRKKRGASPSASTPTRTA